MASKRKSAVACEFCVEQVAAPYLWTFTVPSGMSDAHVKSAWYYFIHHLVNWYGVRVWERQKNGTLHIHAVISGRKDASKVRYLWRRAAGDLANVNVKRVTDGERAGRYLAKYLAKQDRAMRGMRRWSCFGRWPFVHAKVSSIVNHSPESRAFRGVTTDELALWRPDACLDNRSRNWAKMQIARAKIVAGAMWLLHLRERRLYAGRELDPFAPPLPDPGLIIDLDPVTGEELVEVPF